MTRSPASAGGARLTVLGLLCCLAACVQHPTPRAVSAGYGGASYPPPVRSYPPPGPPEDPWGPYVREAATRYGVPELWIREVMAAESGGRLQGADGALVTSSAGAMGLMQVMPDTYEGLRQRHGLGPDPYEPHDNIAAGAAYLREMYDRYGAPAFLAAYNAGPDRLDAYLAGGDPLPNETIGYLSRIAPRISSTVALSGPLAVFADSGNATSYVAYEPPAPAARGGDTPIAAAQGIGEADAAAVVASEPVVARPLPVAAVPASLAVAPRPASGGVLRAPAMQPAAAWAVQVGAFTQIGQARSAAETARALSGGALRQAETELATVSRPDGSLLYRARLAGISSEAAQAACGRLLRQHMDCILVPGAD